MAGAVVAREPAGAGAAESTGPGATGAAELAGAELTATELTAASPRSVPDADGPGSSRPPIAIATTATSTATSPPTHIAGGRCRPMGSRIGASSAIRASGSTAATAAAPRRAEPVSSGR